MAFTTETLFAVVSLIYGCSAIAVDRCPRQRLAIYCRERTSSCYGFSRCCENAQRACGSPAYSATCGRDNGVFWLAVCTDGRIIKNEDSRTTETTTKITTTTRNFTTRNSSTSPQPALKCPTDIHEHCMATAGTSCSTYGVCCLTIQKNLCGNPEPMAPCCVVARKRRPHAKCLPTSENPQEAFAHCFRPRL